MTARRRSRFADDDACRNYPSKPLLADGAPARDALDQIDAVRTVLTGHGRSQAQSARLAVGAQRPCDPILRSRTPEQVE